MSRIETKDRIKAIRMGLKLYKDGEVVLDTVLTGKRNIVRTLQGSLDRRMKITILPEWDAGTIKVFYNYKKNYWNAFDFNSIEEVKEHLSSECCLDPYLVKQFGS